MVRILRFTQKYLRMSQDRFTHHCCLTTTQEKLPVCVETLEIDYDDYYEEVAVNVTIEGPLLEEDT